MSAVELNAKMREKVEDLKYRLSCATLTQAVRASVNMAFKITGLIKMGNRLYYKDKKGKEIELIFTSPKGERI